MKYIFRKLAVLGAASFFSLLTWAQGTDKPFSIKDHYIKKEVYIPMRDGIRLYTAIYLPTDSSTGYPILMQRTPYSCAPYGDKYKNSLGPNMDLAKEKYIFVYQDVRGRYKSEGQFQEVTPAKAIKKTNKDVDESSDTYDAIEWLLKNTRNNGKVGLWGISYPGFFASAALPGAHPAIKAVSPQAPVTDEFIGDDCNHNGAFFLLDNFGFYNYFEGERSADSTNYKPIFSFSTNDAYSYFLQVGTLKKSNGPHYYDNKGMIYSQVLENDTYNQFWQSRNIRTHLKNIKPAVLVVGGWFDAEDMFGALQTYATIEKNSRNVNHLVMGPWTHGAWAASKWTAYASHEFGANLNDYYHQQLETPFFNYYLKGKGSFDAAEVTAFETGSNQWKKFPVWPPASAQNTSFYFGPDKTLKTVKNTIAGSFTSYTSDPANPVPYTEKVMGGRNNEYLGEDQRFASKRPDVITFVTEPLTEDIRIAGPIQARLFVSMTGTDADFVVKLIDVLPEDTPNPSPNPKNYQLAGMQRLVRAEVFRGKFRNSYTNPSAFVPNKIEQVSFNLNDAVHVFQKGHRIMVQVQSSWFPLVDRNPQKFMRIPLAEESDFQTSTIKIYHDPSYPSQIVLPVLK